MARHVFDLIHQAFWTTAIHMTTCSRFFQQLPQIKCLFGIALVVVKLHVASPCIRGQLIHKCGAFFVTGQVNEFEFPHGLRLQLHQH